MRKPSLKVVRQVLRLRITSLTSGSGNWTVPAEVYRIKVTAVGGGGGASAGASTTFWSITGGGGGAYTNTIASNGGGALGGDVNIAGGSGDAQENNFAVDLTVYADGGYTLLLEYLRKKRAINSW